MPRLANVSRNDVIEVTDMDQIKHVLGQSSRAMYYSHDTYGLGHLRRTLTLMHHFSEKIPGINQVVVTGSPSANRFPLPPNSDLIKLPSVTKNHEGAYVPRSLDVTMKSLRDVRRDLLVTAAVPFQPDFFLVDHSPAGMNGEVVRTLQRLRTESPHTRLVIGLRDVMDDPAVVRKQWARDGVYELLDNVYDLILVYGERDIYDIVSKYGLSPQAAAKTRFVGYLGRETGSLTSEQIRSRIEMQTDHLVLVTAGGGGDGRRMIDALLRDMRQDRGAADFDVLVVGGPLMSSGDRESLQHQFDELPNAHYLEFTDDLTSYICAADAVVSMGGYNSVCEILSLGKKGLIVPRVTPRKEQLIRAELLQQHGCIEMIHPDDLGPMRLLDSVTDLLAKSRLNCSVMEMTGLDNALRAVESLWSSPEFASA